MFSLTVPSSLSQKVISLLNVKETFAMPRGSKRINVHAFCWPSSIMNKWSRSKDFLQFVYVVVTADFDVMLDPLWSRDQVSSLFVNSYVCYILLTCHLHHDVVIVSYSSSSCIDHILVILLPLIVVDVVLNVYQILMLGWWLLVVCCVLSYYLGLGRSFPDWFIIYTHILYESYILPCLFCDSPLRSLLRRFSSFVL